MREATSATTGGNNRRRRRPRAAASAAATAATAMGTVALTAAAALVDPAAASCPYAPVSDAAARLLAYAPPPRARSVDAVDASRRGCFRRPRAAARIESRPGFTTASPSSLSSSSSLLLLRMAVSSEDLKAENDERRRMRREGSVVTEEGGEDSADGGALPGSDVLANESAAAAAAAEGSAAATAAATVAAVGVLADGDAHDAGSGGGADDDDDSNGSSGDGDERGSDSILKESGLVRLQRAAAAEIRRREMQKAAAAGEDVGMDGMGRMMDGTGGSGKGRGSGWSGGSSTGRRTDDTSGLNVRIGKNIKQGGSGGTSRSSSSSGYGGTGGGGAPSGGSTSSWGSKAEWIEKASKGPGDGSDDAKDKTITLDQLNRAIERRLNAPPGIDSMDWHAQLPRIEGTVQPPLRDSMSSLLSYNHIEGDWRRHQGADTYNVAVVFGKKLVRDQITVEYASRIRTLARLFKDEYPHFRPSLVCFTGCIGRGNHVSDADAGYIFFRHMCEAQGIDLEGVDVLIDPISKDEAEAVYRVTEGVKKFYVPKWLEQLPPPVPAKKGGGGGSSRRSAGISISSSSSSFALEEEEEEKKVAVHFSLVSTEYHLCNLNDIHHRSPRQSLLKPIEAMEGEFDVGGGAAGGGAKRNGQLGYGFGAPVGGGVGGGGGGFSPDYDEYEDDDDDRGDDVPYASSNRGGGGERRSWGRTGAFPPAFSPTSSSMGVVESSWSFQYATYPFMYARDEAVVFLGKCFLLAEELMPLLVNMKGVVEQKEFFQRDNYLMLASIRRSLVSKVERLHKPSSGLKRSLNIYAKSAQTPPGDGKGASSTRDIVTVLESALLSLGRCVDLVRPAGLLVSSVSRENWRKALRALEHSMSEIRSVCDPDRPLRPTEWGKLVDDEAAMLDIGMQPRRHFVLWKDKRRRAMMSGKEAESSSTAEGPDADDSFFQENNLFWASDE